jgi:hypothetical protein
MGEGSGGEMRGKGLRGGDGRMEGIVYMDFLQA